MLEKVLRLAEKIDVQIGTPRAPTVDELRHSAAAIRALVEEVQKYRERDEVSQAGVNMLEQNQISDELVDTAHRLWRESMILRAKTDALNDGLGV